MTFKLENIVPWGRSAHEYQQMFNLTPTDLTRPILDCGGGPASFNAEMTPQGGSIISCDPLYQFSPEQIDQRIQETRPLILEGVAKMRNRFVWSQIQSLDDLETTRMTAMARFLQDLSQGTVDGRYVVAELPELPFSDRAFSLAISSHLLFTYSDQFSRKFHVAAIRELHRVAGEVRVFPVVENFTGVRSPHLDFVMVQLQAEGWQVEVVPVSYEFQRGGNEMLRIV